MHEAEGIVEVTVDSVGIAIGLVRLEVKVTFFCCSLNSFRKKKKKRTRLTVRVLMEMAALYGIDIVADLMLS